LMSLVNEFDKLRLRHFVSYVILLVLTNFKAF